MQYFFAAGWDGPWKTGQLQQQYYFYAFISLLRSLQTWPNYISKVVVIFCYDAARIMKWKQMNLEDAFYELAHEAIVDTCM